MILGFTSGIFTVTVWNLWSYCWLVDKTTLFTNVGSKVIEHLLSDGYVTVTLENKNNITFNTQDNDE